MPRQRHWVNHGGPGETVFVTTTVLDFVHAFRRPKPRTAMAVALVDQCRSANVVLHAYVVMPHHVHILVRLPETLTVGSLMRRVKPRVAMTVLGQLTRAEREEFSQQVGLNDNSFWQRSFRSIVVETESTFAQKVEYIHSNPVRAELCESGLEYPWSSAEEFASGYWSDEFGLSYPVVLDRLRNI